MARWGQAGHPFTHCPGLAKHSLKYCKSSTTLLSQEVSEVQKEGCGLGLTHISPGSLWQNQVGVPQVLFQSWMHTEDHTGALGKTNDQPCPWLVHLGMAIVQFPRGM